MTAYAYVLTYEKSLNSYGNMGSLHHIHHVHRLSEKQLQRGKPKPLFTLWELTLDSFEP